MDEKVDVSRREVNPDFQPDEEFLRTVNNFKKDLGQIDRFSSQEQQIEKMLDLFVKQGVKKVGSVYKQGGQIGEVEFQPCQDLPAHNWSAHIQPEIEMLFKTLPKFLDDEPGQVYTLENIEKALWAVLFHDLGFLINSQDEIKYDHSGEKFFIHCQQSQQLARQLIPVLTQGRITGEKLDRTVELIGYTEFNFFEASANPNSLGDLMRAIDSYFVYACQPNQIPEGVMALYYEHQAIANPEDEATVQYFNEHIDGEDETGQTLRQKIAESLGIDDTKVKDWFKKGLLTIADLKFPGQSVAHFVASGYASNLEAKYAEYIDPYYGSETSSYLNRQDHEILKRNLRLSLSRVKLRYSQVNHLAYMEAQFTGLEIKRWEQKLQDQGFLTKEVLDKDSWQQAHARMLGWGEYKQKSLFNRLVTPEIKQVLDQVKDKKAALVMLLQDYVRKNHYDNSELSKMNKDKIHLAIAPQAYSGLDLETVLTAFSELNQGNDNDTNLPELKPMITVRRDQAQDLDMGPNGFLAKIKNFSHDYDFEVVFSGKEDESLSEFTKHLDFLAGDDEVNVLIQAGQIVGDDSPQQLGAENIAWAADFVQEHPKIKLAGLQFGRDQLDEQTAQKIEDLIKSERVIATYLSDQQTLFRNQPLEEHPLFGFWQGVLYAVPLGFISNSTFLEKLLLDKLHSLN